MRSFIQRTLLRRAVSPDDWPIRPSPKGPFAFIHINKTAGTSIGHALKLPRKQHQTVREVVDIVGRREWENAYRFAIVRNPWDKVVSHYKHRVRTNQTGLGDHPLPFPEWVAATYGPEQRLPYYDNPKMFQPQDQWLEDAEGRIELDLIGRFEDLAGAFRQIAQRLGFDEELPHLNRTEPSDYRSLYDARTAEWVGNWFKRDTALFGYRFDV